MPTRSRWQLASEKLRARLRATIARIPHALCDLAGYVGAATIVYGCYLIAPALGFIVGGTALIAAAMLIGRRLNATDDTGHRA